MQNLTEIKVKVGGDFLFNHTQVKLLKNRYYSNLTLLDIFAIRYAKLGLLNKAMIYITFSAGLLISTFTLNIVLAFMFSLSLMFLSILKEHFYVLEERLDMMIKDLTLSEEQLNQAVNSNLQLQHQLEEALENHLKISNHLTVAREEIEKITEQVKIKDQEINLTRDELEHSSQQIAVLTADLLLQKKAFTEKITKFVVFLEQKSVALELGLQSFAP